MGLDLRYATVGERSADPAQDSTYTGLQDACLHRLHDVVVRSRFEADHDVRVVAPGGRHDDRHLVLGADPATHLQTAQAGQHEIEHDDVRSEGPQPGQPVLAGPHRGDVVSLAAQREQDALPDCAVVFDEQNAWHELSIRTDQGT